MKHETMKKKKLSLNYVLKCKLLKGENIKKIIGVGSLM